MTTATTQKSEQPAVTRVWQYDNEPHRIHFTLVRRDGGVRHLYTDQGTALFDVLEEYL